MESFTVLAPAQLQRALAVVIESSPMQGSLPQRAEVEAILAKALVGPVARDEYLTALAQTPVTRTSATVPAFDELPQSEAIRVGLAVLTDEQLLAVASRAELLCGLSDEVERAMVAGSAGDYWFEALEMPEDAIPPEYLPRSAVDEVLRFIDTVESDARSGT